MKALAALALAAATLAACGTPHEPSGLYPHVRAAQAQSEAVCRARGDMATAGHSSRSLLGLDRMVAGVDVYRACMRAVAAGATPSL